MPSDLSSPLDLLRDPDKLKRLMVTGGVIGAIAESEVPPNLAWLKPVLFAGIAIADTVSSRWKEAQLAHADAAGASAAAAVTDPAAVLKGAVAAEAAK